MPHNRFPQFPFTHKTWIFPYFKQEQLVYMNLQKSAFEIIGDVYFEFVYLINNILNIFFND